MQYRKLILFVTAILLLIAIFGCESIEDDSSMLRDPVSEELMIESVQENLEVAELARA